MHTIRDDPEQLATHVLAIGHGLVVLDGCHGAGKTELAQLIAQLVEGSEVVHVDDHLDRHSPDSGSL